MIVETTANQAELNAPGTTTNQDRPKNCKTSLRGSRRRVAPTMLNIITRKPIGLILRQRTQSRAVKVLVQQALLS
jgi:hypothetical protein